MSTQSLKGMEVRMFHRFGQAQFRKLLLVVSTCCFAGCANLHTSQHRPAPDRSIVMQAVSQTVRANDSGHILQTGCTDRSCGSEDCMACSNQIEFGRPNAVIDGVGWLFGIPSKILLWDRRAENHNVSPQTAAVVRNYLQSNGMSDVKVRINQYAPGDEWRRLTQNKAVSPGWRYTFGALKTVGYTLVPQRLFGGDNYNPFTNTISIYSDIPAVAVHEAAYARDNANHALRGTYGFGQQIAGLNVWHETEATKLAHNWMQNSRSPQLVRESNRVLGPLYGMKVGGSVGQLVGGGSGVLTVAGAIAGHVVGYSMDQRQQPRTASLNRSTDIQPVSHEQSK